MICANCNLPEKESGSVIKINQCDHVICLKCLITLVQEAKRTLLRCPTNKDKKKITCLGYLDREDIKNVIPEKVCDEYCAKFDNESNEPRPSTSKDVVTHTGESPKCSKEDSANHDSDRNCDNEEEEYMVGSPKRQKIFEESKLSPFEEVKRGWDQMVYYVNELMKTKSLTFYEASVQVDLMPVWSTTKPSVCPVCLDEGIPPGEGIILKDCFHVICRKCIVQHIEHSSEVVEVQCPFSELQFACSSCLKPNELRALTSQEVYEKHYDELSLREAVKSPNIFHCLTPDCKGFGFFDDETPCGIFECPICQARSCLLCKAIHLKTCGEYRQKIKAEEERLQQLKQLEDEEKEQAAFDEQNRLEQRKNEEKSENVIKDYLEQNALMRCPHCNILCYKHDGCSHVICGSCKRDFCWMGLEHPPACLFK